MWIYEQRTGRIRRNNEPVIATGYSGAGSGVNNPLLQDQKSIGPIPLGLYRIHAPIAHPRLGPYALQLTPDAWNDMHGRDDFWIHGDNKSRNQTASQGYIILSRGAREEIFASGDRSLVVI